MERPLARYFCRGERHRLLVEFGPAAIPIGFLATHRVDATMALHDRLRGCEKSFVNASSHQRAAATDPFRVKVRMLLGHAVGRQRSDQTARGAAGCGACHSPDRGRSQPTGGHHWTHARDGEQPQTSEQANPAADCGTGGCAGSSTRSSSMRGFTGHIAGVRSVGNYADVGIRNVGGLEITHSLRSRIVAVVQARNGSGCHERYFPQRMGDQMVRLQVKATTY